jgi:large conductance mechanosensitive channel
MKKFFGEFKKFITRGNIVDMAVGVIVGSSFTAIVNALSNNILKPIINHILRLILGKDALSEVYTFLGEKVYILDEAGLPTSEIDLKNSIYIDWGAFIIAIINFLIVAFVLFCIVKTVNSMRENSENLEARMKKFTKEDRKIMKARGIKPTKKTIEEYIAEKEAAEAKAKADAEAEAKAKAAADRLANPTTEDLLKSILEEMKKNK